MLPKRWRAGSSTEGWVRSNFCSTPRPQDASCSSKPTPHQVEHTVTEEVFGVDLVQAQIRTCLGASLTDLDLSQERIGVPRGYAIQLRINAESMQSDGSVLPSSGQITSLDMPMGTGIRVDGMAYVGYRNSPSFDSLLTKLIVHSRSHDYQDLISKAKRALRELRIQGLPTNQAFLGAILSHPEFAAHTLTTRWVDEHLPQLVAVAPESSAFFAREDSSVDEKNDAQLATVEEGLIAIRASLSGSLVELLVQPGDAVGAGSTVALLEAMKMQYPVQANETGTVVEVRAASGSMVSAGQILFVVQPGDVQITLAAEEASHDLDHVRPDLAELNRLLALTQDTSRPEAVERRHAQGDRTARENVADLVDTGSFIEYGQLIVAAQRSKHSLDKLRQISPADGLVGGLATINADLFGPEDSQAVIAAYDYTVMAGTQGAFNHKKQDRLFQLAAELRRPVVLLQRAAVGGLTISTNIRPRWPDSTSSPSRPLDACPD